MERLKKLKKTLLTRCKSMKEKKEVKECIFSSNPDTYTLPRCKSFPQWCSPSPSPSSQGKAKRPVTPGGCFSVYVGSARQRFVIKAKYANHHLFKMLLDDAERQYGYCSDGPLLLPCDVDYFLNVLAEMDSDNTDITRHHGCGGYGSYGLLSPSKLIRMNQF
ncbi:auxin-responsive protein SAUR32-like [Chenopodium quinoa]|uniref:auxin-responsive protein SAUR32-like n=1 Tax=Chenopodium quinoa TaxID=63459 RepID=UPI000B77C21D|nr:auxin-responsive protein SAUR32-like [Chenopodium quinoa]